MSVRLDRLVMKYTDNLTAYLTKFSEVHIGT